MHEYEFFHQLVPYVLEVVKFYHGETVWNTFSPLIPVTTGEKVPTLSDSPPSNENVTSINLPLSDQPKDLNQTHKIFQLKAFSL